MRRPILYAFVFLGVYLSYRVLSPFFVALTWAVLLAILFRGMQLALARRMGPNSAALITTLVVGVLIVGPAGVLISALVQEVPEAIESLQRASQSAPRQIQRVWDEIRRRSPVALPEDQDADGKCRDQRGAVRPYASRQRHLHAAKQNRKQHRPRQRDEERAQHTIGEVDPQKDKCVEDRPPHDRLLSCVAGSRG